MKIGIVGSAGHWSYALDELPKHALTGICPGFDGEDMSGCASLLAQHGVQAKIFGGFDELLETNPDVMIVNTRFDLNASYTKRCLLRDIYVFSEKPLAITEEALDELENVKTHAFVTAMFGISYEPWCLCLRENAQKIGVIRMINARKSYKLGTRPAFFSDRATFGGLIPWVAIHALHWIPFTTGLSFASVLAGSDAQYNAGNGDLETTAACLFRMNNGALATVTADYYRPQGAPTHDDDRLRLVGTDGVLEYDNRTGVSLLDSSGAHRLALPERQDVFALFLRRIEDGVSGVSPKESFDATRTALRAREAADTGRTILL